MKVGDAVVSEIETKTRRAAADKRDAQTDAARQTAAAQRDAAQSTPPAHELESVTRQIDSFLKSQNHQLNFRVDQGSGKMVVTVTDAETGEVIRQVPGEEALKMAQRIEDMTGLLEEKA